MGKLLQVMLVVFNVAVAGYIIWSLIRIRAEIALQLHQTAGLLATMIQREIKMAVGDARGDITVLSSRVIDLENVQKRLVGILKEVAMENPIEHLNDPSVTVRRMRSLRTELYRMEAESMQKVLSE